MNDNLGIQSTKKVLEQFLNASDMVTATCRAGKVGLTPEAALAVLASIVEARAIPPCWEFLWSGQGGSQALLGRWILALAALRSLRLLAEAPVVAEVREQIARTYRMIAETGREDDEIFIPPSREFRETAEIALLRRFVAGQLHWKISGIPRSWLLRMNSRDALRTLGAVWRMGSWAPCFEAHLPSRSSPFLIESEYRRCYVRMARSMELQPDIRGIIGSSWLHSEETMRFSPHLNWINRLFLDNGGLLVHLGPASPESGFLVGSEQRRQSYNSGAYRPREAMFIWPRDKFLQWAQGQ